VTDGGEFNHQCDRRRFLATAALGAAGALARRDAVRVGGGLTDARPAREPPIRQVRAGVLDVGYYELGPGDGPPVLLLHGSPYSIESYAEVAPRLAARGCRVIVPTCGATAPRAS
jgi:hypothetical protein